MDRLCKSAGCKAKAAPKKGYCHPCRHKREKELDLAAWAFRKLKSNCKRRRLAAPESLKASYDFLIDLPYFRAFCAETQILLGRGIQAHSLSIDRKREHLGYRPGNLRVLENADNVSKENARRKQKIYDWELAYKKRIGATECAEESFISEFRYVVSTPNPVR